jgi:hypothetical protein
MEIIIIILNYEILDYSKPKRKFTFYDLFLIISLKIITFILNIDRYTIYLNVYILNYVLVQKNLDKILNKTLIDANESL